MTAPRNEIEAGYAALRAADWSGARAQFEAALRHSDEPEAHDGLGIALWWQNRIDEAHQQRISAFIGFKGRGDTGRAARIACWLGREQVFLNSSLPAMQGWFARAERLLEDSASASDGAWCALLRASILAEPPELEHTALRTIETARTSEDAALEALALAFHGLALVAQGRVGSGMTRLDEAMIMTTSGEVTDFMTISEVFCVMLSACEAAGDLVRGDHWCQVAEAFAQRYGCPFLSAYCRTTYGSLLSAAGRWSDAETALTDAVRAFEAGHRGLRVHAVIRLAELRVHQGRYEEAEIMLTGLEDRADAVVPLARLHLAKGDLATAKVLLTHTLPERAALTLHHLPALLLLVEVHLRLDDREGALAWCDPLLHLGQIAGSPHLSAQIELVRGQVELHAGAFSQAKTHFEGALAHLHAYDQSLLAGRARLQMAHMLRETDPTGAVVWAKAALATFERLGAARDSAESAALLRQLGGGGIVQPRQGNLLTRRESEIIGLLALGLSNREIADRLVISPRTAEHHVQQILGKLGLHSRAEVAALIASGKLTTAHSES